MWAGAFVGSVAVVAGATIQAGLGVTFVDIMLTVAASEARGANTSEGVDPIHTGTTVEA